MGGGDSFSGQGGMHVDEFRRDAFERRISAVARPVRAGLPAVLTGPSPARALAGGVRTVFQLLHSGRF